MDKSQSKILCPVKAPTIRKTLSVPNEFAQRTQNYQEEDIIRFFRESPTNSEEAFLKSCSKPDSEPINLSYPIDLGQFNEETQWCITLTSQFLGLDTDAYVPESLLSLLFVLDTCLVEPELPGQSCQSCRLKFDEFLAKNICS